MTTLTVRVSAGGLNQRPAGIWGVGHHGGRR